MTYADLEKAFGKDKLLTDTVLAGTPMMDEERATEDRINSTIEAPEGRIYVTWAAGKEAKKIEKLSLSIGDAPRYKFANGISVGSTLKDFKKINGKGDFEFYGLGWQYAGVLISETAQGDFFQEFPCFSAVFTTKDGQYDKVQKLMGDSKFKASKVSEKEEQELIIGSITINQP